MLNVQLSRAQWSWVLTGLAAILASIIRLRDLDAIPHLVFDETYYVKDSWSLWSLGYEGTWQSDANTAFENGITSGLGEDGAYVVHPPVGRWLLGLGMGILGQDSPTGWRLGAALTGIAGVILVCRLAWQLFSSLLVTVLAGALLATDGTHIVMSRTGLLDIFLSTFVLAAFLAVALDQRGLPARLRGSPPDDAEPDQGEPGTSSPVLVATLGWRPWLLVAGVMLGLACATKWSGIYAVAVLGLFVVGREALWRYRLKDPHWLQRTFFPDGLIAFGQLVAVSAFVYLVSWVSWFTHPSAWGRTEGGNALADWFTYHRHMWNFHQGLASEHPYMSDPSGWLLQARPTSFYFEQTGDGMVTAVTSLGNPALWWLGIPALIALVGATAWKGRWQTGFILLGFVALYLPWFIYTDRTIFSFYTVAFAPFLALAVAWLLGVMLGAFRKVPLAVSIVGAVLLLGIFFVAGLFMPLWLGQPITMETWQKLMWFPGWI